MQEQTFRLTSERYVINSWIRSNSDLSTCLGCDRSTNTEVIIKYARIGGQAVGLLERARRDFARLHNDPTLQSAAQSLGHDTEGGLYWVRRYISGSPLARYMDVQLSIADVVDLGLVLLNALAHAHDLGVLHRGIKPSNVVLPTGGGFGNAELVDYCCGRASFVSDENTAALRQNLPYMAPEQSGVLQHEITAASDLYAVGCLLHACLSGRAVFDGESVGEILRHHLTLTAPLLRPSRSEVPPQLDACLVHLLEKQPQNRYQTARAARDDLLQVRKQLWRDAISSSFAQPGVEDQSELREPDLVGRDKEMHVLHEAYQEAGRGAGDVVLVEGESGGGKTRLLGELKPPGAWFLRGQGRDEAALRPFEVLEGWVTAILQRSAEDPTWGRQLRLRLEAHNDALCHALPELTPLLKPSPGRKLGPEHFGELRSIQAIVELMQALEDANKTCVFVLDDCQWADELSIKAVQAWQKKQHPAASRHALMVLAFRSNEVPEGSLLRRLSVRAHIHLQPFSIEDTRLVAESMAGALPAVVINTLQNLSDGNPFMISAIMHGLLEAGALFRGSQGWQVHEAKLRQATASHKAAEFLARRLRNLPPHMVRVLSIAAVIGKDFCVSMVAMLMDTSAETVRHILATAARARVVWCREDGERVTFVHDKLRAAVLSLLPDSERQPLHLAVAQHRELHDPTRIFDIAYHYHAAGKTADALPYAIRAGQMARAQHSLKVAEVYFRMAEEGVNPNDTATRKAIAEGLGDVFMLSGRYVEARARFEEAGKLCVSPRGIAEVHGKLGELAFKRGAISDAALHIEQALNALRRRVPQHKATCILWLTWEVLVQATHTLLPKWLVGRYPLDQAEKEDAFLAAHLYSRYAYVSWYGKGKYYCGWAHLRNMNLCELYPPSLALAQAYSEHAPVMTILPWNGRALAYAEKSLTIRRTLGDLWGEGQSLNFLGVVLFGAARFEACVETCQHAIKILERTGDLWEISNATWHIAFAYYEMGQLKDAYLWSQRAVKEAEVTGNWQGVAIGLSAMSKVTQGRVNAERIGEARRQTLDDAHTQAEVAQADAWRLMRDGAFAQAVTVLLAAGKAIERSGTRNAYVIGVPVLLTQALRGLFENITWYDPRARAVVLRRMRKAQKVALELTRSYPNLRPAMLRECAYAAAAKGAHKRARGLLRESLILAECHQARLEQARTLLAWGDIAGLNDWPEAQHNVQRGQALMESLSEPLEMHLAAGRQEPHSASLADRFANILDAAHDIATALDTPALYAAVRGAAQVLLRGDTCCIVAQENKVTRIVWPREDMREIADKRMAALVELALQTSKPVTGDEPSLASLPPTAGVRSVLCAPIGVSGGVGHCFYAAHGRIERLFGAPEIALAEFISVIGSASLDNTSGFSKIRTLLQERERLCTQAETALRARDDFISIAAHEIRTPITSLMLQSDAISRTIQRHGQDRLPVARLQRFFMLNARQLRTLRRITDDLVDVSRMTTGHLRIVRTEVNLVTVLSDLIEFLRENLQEAGCTVTFDHDGPAAASVDQARIEQVMTNLLTNCMRYAPGAPVHVHVRNLGDHIAIRVHDEGPGIPVEQQDRIFGRFERGKAQSSVGGLGLGLFIVSEIVRAHGGTVYLVSTPEHGSEFIIELPRDARTAADAVAEERRAEMH